MSRLAAHILVATLTFLVGLGVALLWNLPASRAVRLTDAPAPALPHPPLFEPSVLQPSCERPRMNIPEFEVFNGGTASPGSNIVYGGLLQNKAVRKPAPHYPLPAKAEGVSGAVRVKAVVDEQGNVVKAFAVSGHLLLRPAAASAACRSQFSPTLISGRPVRVLGEITYNFVLQ